jgi:D-alanyl-lipoteichoic acid acyltransferase DltB (MBOAT superfamily)
MVFNSPEFLIFFALVYPAYLLLRKPVAQNVLLLFASYVFYGWAAPKYLLLLFFYTAITFIAGLGLEAATTQRRRRLFLWLSVGTDLAVLCWFKYFNFFIHEIVAALGSFGIPVQPIALQIFLPIGISFFTFQSIAYIVDVYRGIVPATRSIIVFSLFKAFFPLLVAGPIERPAHMMPQLEKERRIRATDLLQGVYWILLGFFLKCVIADRLASYVDYHYSGTLGPYQGSLATMTAGLAFGIQIYGDFAGYSYIALGISRLLGIQVERNFLAPYLATNIQEFWRRWHVTLSLWLRDYLYIPLGGARGGKTRTYINLLVTMALGGLWHGASWTFVLWGLFHGIGLAAHRLASPVLSLLPKWTSVLGWSLTTLFVTLGWVLFRSNSLGQFLEIVNRMFAGGPADRRDFEAATIVTVFFLVILVVQRIEELYQGKPPFIQRISWPYRLALLTAFALSVFAVGFGDHRFIYFQF